MKKATTWSKVRAGDIISFKYKGSNNRLLTHTVVVFSPRYNMQTKKGTKRGFLTAHCLKLGMVTHDTKCNVF